MAWEQMMFSSCDKKFVMNSMSYQSSFNYVCHKLHVLYKNLLVIIYHFCKVMCKYLLIIGINAMLCVNIYLLLLLMLWYM